ncbi:superinfection exclusion B family protein [Paraburkholderia bannensis]|uniref:superinfection exclusion B family protein n=1 Tax=Paraburkholderia bannensis TaxID=765414 RepID=UPI002AB648D6|nr:superinfection exclusion B family protein [Paraburkholderia bannensis]
MGIVNDVQEGIKAFGEIAVKPLLAVALGSGFLLFARPSILDAAGMTKIVADYRPWLGGAFTLSCAYLLAHAVKYAADSVTAWQQSKNLDKRRAKWLATLTPDERGRLIPYIRDQRASVRYPIEDGVVGGLVGKGILFRSSNVGHAISGFAFNLQPWAREELEKRPELLHGAEEIQRDPLDWMSR